MSLEYPTFLGVRAETFSRGDAQRIKFAENNNIIIDGDGHDIIIGDPQYPTKDITINADPQNGSIQANASYISLKSSTVSTSSYYVDTTFTFTGAAGWSPVLNNVGEPLVYRPSSSYYNFYFFTKNTTLQDDTGFLKILKPLLEDSNKQEISHPNFPGRCVFSVQTTLSNLSGATPNNIYYLGFFCNQSNSNNASSWSLAVIERALVTGSYEDFTASGNNWFNPMSAPSSYVITSDNYIELDGKIQIKGTADSNLTIPGIANFGTAGVSNILNVEGELNVYNGTLSVNYVRRFPMYYLRCTITRINSGTEGATIAERGTTISHNGTYWIADYGGTTYVLTDLKECVYIYNAADGDFNSTLPKATIDVDTSYKFVTCQSIMVKYRQNGSLSDAQYHSYFWATRTI